MTAAVTPLLNNDEIQELRERHEQAYWEPEGRGSLQPLPYCASSEHDDEGWPCSVWRLLETLAALGATRWHHNPDAPSEHFCEDCDDLRRNAALGQAWRACEAVRPRDHQLILKSYFDGDYAARVDDARLGIHDDGLHMSTVAKSPSLALDGLRERLTPKVSL